MLLRVNNVSLNYGRTEALRNVSFEVEAGQIVSIIGANGAGKSSLLRCISGLARYQQGEIVYDGRALPSKAYKVALQGAILVPEGRRVFGELSVDENLQVGGYMLRRRAEVDALKDRQYQLFPQLARRKAQAAATLSGGEQQMLAIARAMMSKPRLLLLGEPSLGLAPLIIEDVFRAIGRIHEEGVTVLLVEQNANKALEVADFAVVLENGAVRKTGVGRELLDAPEIVEAYLGKRHGGKEA
ncbi:MAG: ABC transporter ATP-binding protein [Candidatus Limiplasma sp.]|nr:ABC transporter ATP-binding protein [Candidatus Limiplasma sp.]